MAERSEKQKMLAGELYNSTGPELLGERHAAQRLLARYNATDVGDAAGRLALLRQLFGAVGDNLDILPRFHCDYGYNIRVGRNCFINYNCVFLDCAAIEIGDDLQMAPAVQLYTALVYQGPGLVMRIKRDLSRRLRADGFSSIAEAAAA